MRRSLDPSLMVAVLTLGFATNTAAEEGTQEYTELIPSPRQFHGLCENLMSQVLRQTNVKFAESSAEISTNSRALLDEIVEIAFDCPSLLIKVTGHTDSTGNENANRALSQARAESVVAYLIDHGIERERLSAKGVGSDIPIESNENDAGRQHNRRIEFDLSFRGQREEVESHFD